MQGGNSIISGKEAGQIFEEGQGMSPDIGSLVGIMYVSILDLHPLCLSPELHPVSVIAPCCLLFDSLLEHSLVVFPTIELLLGVLLASSL